MTQPTPWADVANALQAAVVKATGLAADHVVWRSQDANQPTLSYIDLAVLSTEEVGEPWVDDDYDPDAVPGAEVTLTAKSETVMQLQVEVFTALSTPDDAAALALANRVRVGLRLPSIRDALYAVGVIVVDAAQVQFVPAIVAAGFRGRATFDARVSMPSVTASETTTFIETVSGKGTGQLDGEPVVTRNFRAVIG